VEGGRASEALREGAGASNVGSAVGVLGGALLGGVDGWHRSMIGGATVGDLGGVVGGEGLGLGGGAGALGGLANHGREDRP
jgi:hypothetical protein